MSWLLSSVSEEVFGYVIGLASSYQVWSALHQAFGFASQNRQLQLHIDLRELKPSVMIFQFHSILQKAEALADEVGAAGKPLFAAEFNAINYRNI